MKTILLIDDDIFVRSLLAEGLLHFGLKTLHANNGQEALEVLDQSSVDAIILDIAMPTMDGFEFAEKIKESFGKVTILVH
ncbi:response regulator, partial [bacterium]|nr:response regulator [bacterium]